VRATPPPRTNSAGHNGISAAAAPRDVTEVAISSPTRKIVSTRLVLASFGLVVLAFLILATYFGFTRRTGKFEDWLWFTTTALGLAGSVALGLLFFQASNELPFQISRQLLDLDETLQSPLTGYETVTRRIIEVCESAEHYYLAATRMPLIGAISDGPYCQQYQTALTSKILARVRTELVCLEDGPLYEFVRTGAPQGFKIKDAESVIREFLEQQLPSYVRQSGTKLILGRSAFMPIQMAIADGNKAILYFSPRRDLTQDSDIRGFYTTNRDIISALIVGFYYIQHESRQEFSTLGFEANGA
jgi:hypothetical protein